MRSPRLPAGRPVHWVVGFVILALLLRLLWLGERVAHWDEARVGYWALRYAEAGTYHFRPITHGPFLHIVNGDFVFPLLGASDASARLIVALVGGLLPACAWLFRNRLRPIEMVGLAGMLAVTPVLLYYSRFMRNDVLVAAFLFAAFGFTLRALESRRWRYAYPAVAAIAFGFTTKENAIVYLIVWVGAGALVLDHTLYRVGKPREVLDPVIDAFGRAREALRERPRSALRRLGGWLGHGAVLGVVFISIIAFFYLPRGPGQIGLLEWVTEPWLLPEILESGVIDPLQEGLFDWLDRTESEDSLAGHYITPLTNMGSVIAYGALAVAALAVVGFVRERYRTDTRELVLFAGYWGAASLVGYPLAASVQHPAWLAVHVVIPLAIPAAVGLGWLLEELHTAVDRDELLLAGVLGLIVIALGGQLASAAIGGVYLSPQSHDNEFVQYAQSASPELKAAVDDIESLAESTAGVDVLYVGEAMYMENESDADRPEAPSGWFDRLPLPWYTAIADAETASIRNVAELRGAFERPPPVVIAPAELSDRLQSRLPSYEVGIYDRFAPGADQIAIFIDTARL